MLNLAMAVLENRASQHIASVSEGAGETHIQVLQAVPAEGVFAALTQHLCAALVPLDVDTTHGTLLDGHVGVAVGVGPAHREGRHRRGSRLTGARCIKPRRPREPPGGV